MSLAAVIEDWLERPLETSRGDMRGVQFKTAGNFFVECQLCGAAIFDKRESMNVHASWHQMQYNDLTGQDWTPPGEPVIPLEGSG